MPKKDKKTPEPVAATEKAATGIAGTIEETKPTVQAGVGENTEKPGATPKASDAVTKVGKSILKNNPGMPVVYMTADGRGFYERNDAENHAKTLTNRVVTPVKR